MRVTAGVLRAITSINQTYVPRSKPIIPLDVERLQEFVSSSNRLLVLTGAGISTESGIPDYRSEGVGLYARTDRRPVQYQDFVRSSAARQRYWARNFIGWPQFSKFEPNEAHEVLSEWECQGKVYWLVTQNVDSLHYKAGSKRVTELHGSSARTMCMSCPFTIPRLELQHMFTHYNPGWYAPHSMQLAPDGDVILTDEQVQGFKVPGCPNCGGNLQPDIVFFGDNVRRPIVDFVFELVHHCDSLLVLGSSLYVYSGFRFVHRARELGKNIAIVNIGDTRADHLAHLKLEAPCAQLFKQISL